MREHLAFACRVFTWRFFREGYERGLFFKGISNRIPLISTERRGVMPKDAVSVPGRDPQPIQVERCQMSHGRMIRVVSVFPAHGSCSPEDKLKKLIDMELNKSLNDA